MADDVEPFALNVDRLQAAIEKLAGPNACQCAERLDGNEKPFPDTLFSRYHDCEYIKARNRMIPQAMQTARARLQSRQIPEDHDDYGALWTQEFASEMQWLCRGLLL